MSTTPPALAELTASEPSSKERRTRPKHCANSLTNNQANKPKCTAALLLPPLSLSSRKLLYFPFPFPGPEVTVTRGTTGACPVIQGMRLGGGAVAHPLPHSATAAALCQSSWWSPACSP